MKKITTILITLLMLVVIQQPVSAQTNNLTEELTYYILVDRFTNENAQNDGDADISNPDAYHGGDFQGITNKLDYIKELGFTSINLSPIMSNEQLAYHGFLIDDYESVENHFGTLEELKNLVKEAHDKEMKVFLDFVVSHASAENVWMSKEDSHIAGETSNFWGENLLIPNLKNEEVSSYFLDVASYWANQTGIDGYRLYVSNKTPSDFVERFTDHVNEMGMSIIIDSIDNQGASINSEQLVMDETIQSSMSTVFSDYGNNLKPLFDNWPINNNVGIHIDDQQTVRFTRETIKAQRNPITRWKLAYTFMYTMPGAPVIYQGSEVPMDNGKDYPDHQMAQTNSGEEELQNHIKQLAAIRKQFPALVHGDVELIQTNGAMALYKRLYQDEEVYIAINNDEETKTITINDVPDEMQLKGLIQDNIVRELDNGEYKIALDRETSDIFILENDTGLNWYFITFIIAVLGAFVGGVTYLSIKSKRTNKD